LEGLHKVAVRLLHKRAHPAIEDRIEAVDRIGLAPKLADNGLAHLGGEASARLTGLLTTVDASFDPEMSAALEDVAF